MVLLICTLFVSVVFIERAPEPIPGEQKTRELVYLRTVTVWVLFDKYDLNQWEAAIVKE